MRRLSIIVFGSTLAALAAAAGALALLNIATYTRVHDVVYERVEDVPQREIAVVLASGSRARRPSDAAVQRLESAVELLRSGRVNRVLLSGQAFEVDTMRTFLQSRDVPATAITIDDSSTRTFDTCDRLKNVFGFASVVLVSQAEHVVRAVFTCRELGVPALGLVAPGFGGSAFWTYRLHEIAALPLAWWDVEVRAR